ncbi:hypothetical protein ACFL6N_07890 [Thermodesulfobacteriota bacterium]
MNQLNLFNQPTFRSAIQDIKQSMHDAVRSSKWSREQLLDRMNDLADRYGVALVKGNSRGLTLDTFEKWLNPKEIKRYPSPMALLVFCAAVETHAPLASMGQVIGAQVIGEEDIRLLSWAKAYHRAKDARHEMKRLEEGL